MKKLHLAVLCVAMIGLSGCEVVTEIVQGALTPEPPLTDIQKRQYDSAISKSLYCLGALDNVGDMSISEDYWVGQYLAAYGARYQLASRMEYWPQDQIAMFYAMLANGSKDWTEKPEGYQMCSIVE